MYNPISCFVRNKIPTIIEEGELYSWQVYQLYVELLRMTPDIQSFVGLGIHFQRPVKITPELYKVDVELNQKLERHFGSHSYHQRPEKSLTTTTILTIGSSISNKLIEEPKFLRTKTIDNEMDLHKHQNAGLVRPKTASLSRDQYEDGPSSPNPLLGEQLIDTSVIEEEKRPEQRRRTDLDPRRFSKEDEGLIYYESLPNVISSPVSQFRETRQILPSQ
eukprot:TRINITY_DN9194_c0_g1_i2.p1 TRINITY_DN9194_c0_g1~~TRINITY_DN9194_c0_g1_i2.p1  ORF type:complete len:219 (+),score=38.05 TRINITY_DN9194_c0_g1_i2:153-809(+)